MQNRKRSTLISKEPGKSCLRTPGQTKVKRLRFNGHPESQLLTIDCQTFDYTEYIRGVKRGLKGEIEEEWEYNDFWSTREILENSKEIKRRPDRDRTWTIEEMIDYAEDQWQDGPEPFVGRRVSGAP